MRFGCHRQLAQLSSHRQAGYSYGGGIPACLGKEILWSDQSLLTLGSSIKFVAEVVRLCTLVNGEYEIHQLRGNQTIISPTFPDLKLTAEQVLRAGR